MTKELQDRAWASLPKEARVEIRMIFYMPSKYDYPDSIRRCLLDIYGDNITSDTESDEKAKSSKKSPNPKHHIGEKIAWLGKERIISAIHPDNPIMYEFEGCTGMLTEEQIESCKGLDATVEPKYKFSLGQEVILHFHGGEIGTISERLPPQDGIVWNCYKVKGMPHHIWRENELDPYNNPILTYDIGQMVRVIKVTNLAIRHKIGTIEELPNNSHCDMYKVRFENGYAHLEAYKLEPYTEENK